MVHGREIVLALLVIGCSSCASIEDLQPAGGGRIYDVSYNSAHRIALDALEEKQFSIKRDEPSKGEIRAQTPEYWNGIFHCYGNLIGIFLAPVGASQTRVEIQSRYVQAGADLACKDKAQEVISSISAKLRQGSANSSMNNQPAPSMPTTASFSSAQPELLQARFRELADQLSVGIKEHRVSRLAVLPMADTAQKTNTLLGNYLTEKVTNELYKTSSVKVIERSQLQRVMEELNLTLRGSFDDASVKRIGKLLGVDAVIMGTYAELGSDTVDINTRIVTIETAEVVGVGSIQIPRNSVEKLVR